MMRMRDRYSLALPLLASLVAGCGAPSQPAPAQSGRSQKMRFPVEVQTVEASRVEYMVSAVGSVEAFERVQVAARVPGAVERVLFREGDRVTAGQPLVTIDTERYRIALQAVQASLERAEASHAEAEAALKRRQGVVAQRPELIPTEEVDAWRTKAQIAAAQVAEARAAVAQAELNLRHASASAPAAGTIETRNVATGQYVQAGTLLATLVRREPLLVRFNVPESEAAPLHPGMSVTFETTDKHGPFHARITHVGQSADTQSRMVAVTAEVDDDKRADLRPGSFAQVSVPVGAPSNAPVVPQMAVRPTEHGFVAFVVEGEVARERLLRLGMRTKDGKLEVQSGLALGDLVVVRGAEALRDGAQVQQSAPPPSRVADERSAPPAAAREAAQ